MRIGYKISLLVVGTALLTTAVLTISAYRAAKRQYLAGIDRQLTAAVSALPRVLGEDYLAAAISAVLPPERYKQTVLSLSELADESGVYYLYAFEKTGDEIVHLATSASPAEREKGDWSFFREPYREPPAALLATFADGKPRFAEYTDEYGTFRSAFLSRKTADGRTYVVGADSSLNEIHHELRAMVWRRASSGAAVALAAAVLGVLLARRISRPIQTLSTEVRAWSGRAFAADPAIQHTLAGIQRHHRDEVGHLAGEFIDVQNRLQTYMQELIATTQAKQKIEQQLEIARTIQESLLPQEPPKIQHFELTGWCQPADQTGGDYFDWIQFPSGQVMITIGDVTGHGIGPALVTAASRAYARATLSDDQALDAAVMRLNELLHGDLKGERFVTLIAGLLDPNQRKMTLLAAGHGPIAFYSRRRDKVELSDDTHGMALGITDQIGYDQPMELAFEPGDVLVLVSDGVIDWMNPAGDMFGTQRLHDSLLRSCREEPARILDRLRADVAAFNGGKGQSDDTTALIIRCIS